MQKILWILGLMVVLSGIVQAQNRTIDIPAQDYQRHYTVYPTKQGFSYCLPPRI